VKSRLGIAASHSALRRFLFFQPGTIEGESGTPARHEFLTLLTSTQAVVTQVINTGYALKVRDKQGEQCLF
jgi:hypothetical protein